MHQVDDETTRFLRDNAIDGQALVILGSDAKEYRDLGLRARLAVKLAHIVKSLDPELLKNSKSGLSILWLPSLKLTVR